MSLLGRYSVYYTDNRYQNRKILTVIDEKTGEWLRFVDETYHVFSYYFNHGIGNLSYVRAVAKGRRCPYGNSCGECIVGSRLDVDGVICKKGFQAVKRVSVSYPVILEYYLLDEKISGDGLCYEHEVHVDTLPGYLLEIFETGKVPFYDSDTYSKVYNEWVQSGMSSIEPSVDDYLI